MRYAIAKALNLIIINSAKQGFLSPSLAQVIEYFQVIGLATREDVGWNAPSVSAVFQALFIGSSPVTVWFSVGLTWILASLMGIGVWSMMANAMMVDVSLLRFLRACMR